jgi:catechol 2,3-dioxygenase-like lactoylglutathione lyase family enzyme
MRFALIALLPALLCAADLKIDHVTIAGRDLKAIQSGLERVGIPTVYGGAHANRVTEMALVSFEDGSYLEAIALQTKADPKGAAQHEWARFLKERAMPAAWALEAPNLEAEVGRLKAAGVAVSAPVRAGRVRPDGVKLEWETANVGSEDRGTFFPFLIHDFTPRAQRAFPQGTPTSKEFGGIALVVIAVRNLDAAVERYRKAFGLPEAVKDTDPKFQAEVAVIPGAPVVLAQPSTPDSWIAARIGRFGEGPCAFVLRGRRHPLSSLSHVNTSRWAGREIVWLDVEKLGWRALGIEELP